MKRNDWIFYLAVGILAFVYFVGEATSLIFFAMLSILPSWVWLLGLLDSNN
jgi:hypothetical protein